MRLTLQEKVDALDLPIGQPLTDDMFSDREKAVLTAMVDDLAFRRAVRDKEPAILRHGRLSQKETAPLLGVVRATVANWVHTGRLHRRNGLFPSDFCIDGAQVVELIRSQVFDASLLPAELAEAWKAFDDTETYQAALLWQVSKRKHPRAKGLNRDWMRFTPPSNDAAPEKKR